MKTQAPCLGENKAEQPGLHGAAGVVATACLQGEQAQHGRPLPVASGGEVRTSTIEAPTGRSRGTGRAGVGVGRAHSTEEAGNDRRGKGPELKGQRRKQRGNVKESDGESSTTTLRMLKKPQAASRWEVRVELEHRGPGAWTPRSFFESDRC